VEMGQDWCREIVVEMAGHGVQMLTWISKFIVVLYTKDKMLWLSLELKTPLLLTKRVARPAELQIKNLRHKSVLIINLNYWELQIDIARIIECFIPKFTIPLKITT